MFGVEYREGGAGVLWADGLGENSEKRLGFIIPLGLVYIHPPGLTYITLTHTPPPRIMLTILGNVMD